MEKNIHNLETWSHICLGASISGILTFFFFTLKIAAFFAAAGILTMIFLMLAPSYLASKKP